MANARILIATEFNRSFWDFPRPTFTKWELTSWTRDEKTPIWPWLRSLEEKGLIKFLAAIETVPDSSPLVEVLALIPPDLLEEG